MPEVNEYARVLQTLYSKSLILEDTSDFHPVLRFWYFDALAHLDFSISMLSFNADSPRNLMSREYLRHRADLAKEEKINQFPGFLAWLEENSPQDFEKFPLFIQKVYSPKDPASYRSFRLTLNPEEKRPIPSEQFQMMVEEMFERSYLSALYNGSSVSEKLAEYSGKC